MKYRVFWKGECLGEFSVGEIEDMLSRGAIGMLHSVELKSGKCVQISEFLSDGSLNIFDEPYAAKDGDFDFIGFGYVLAGMSFLSLYIYAVTLIYCAFLLKGKRTKSAARIAIFSSIAALAGFAFFEKIISAV